MGTVLTFVWGVIFYVVTQTSILFWTGLVLTGPVGRARLRLERRASACFLVGGIFFLATLGVSGALVGHKGGGLIQLLGWVLAAPMFASSVIGGAALASILADRIRRQMRVDSPLAALALASLVTTLASILPVIGWFVFLPIAGFMSIGAGLLGLVSRGGPATQPRPDAESNGRARAAGAELEPDLSLAGGSS